MSSILVVFITWTYAKSWKYTTGLCMGFWVDVFINTTWIYKFPS